MPFVDHHLLFAWQKLSSLKLRFSGKKEDNFENQLICEKSIQIKLKTKPKTMIDRTYTKQQTETEFIFHQVCPTYFVLM